MSSKIFTAGELHDLAAQRAETNLFRAASERYWGNMVTKDHAEPLVAETHDTEADIYIVLEGEADLYLGGAIIDPTTPIPGQHRGAALANATRHHIAAGDLIVIPETTPHLLDARNSRIVYLVIKEDVGK